MSENSKIDHDFAERLVEEFLDEGYRSLDPRLIRGELPSGYMPDLAFKRGPETIIVEVKPREEHRNLEHLRLIKEAVEAKPNWKFKLYVSPPSQSQTAPKDNTEGVGKLLSRAKQLNRTGEFEAASVLLWMATEIALRTLLTSRQSRPNLGVSGMSMARTLHGLGELTPEELQLIRQAWQSRNLSVHGFRLEPMSLFQANLYRLLRRLRKEQERKR